MNDARPDGRTPHGSASSGTRRSGLLSRPAKRRGAGARRPDLAPGLRKAALALDAWPKELAPSKELRGWYGHRPERFHEFRRRYLDELTQPDRRRPLELLRSLVARQPVVLLTATRDVEHSHAVVLADVVQERT